MHHNGTYRQPQHFFGGSLMGRHEASGFTTKQRQQQHNKAGTSRDCIAGSLRPQPQKAQELTQLKGELKIKKKQTFYPTVMKLLSSMLRLCAV